MSSFWIEPDGTFYDIPPMMHEAFAKEHGSDARGLIMEGWIRGYEHQGHFNFHIRNLSDEQALLNIEDYLFSAAYPMPHFLVRIETEHPLEPSLMLSGKDVVEMGFRPAIRREQRLIRIRPPGVHGLRRSRRRPRWSRVPI
jgi:hypothetical protein